MWWHDYETWPSVSQTLHCQAVRIEENAMPCHRVIVLDDTANTYTFNEIGKTKNLYLVDRNTPCSWEDCLSVCTDLVGTVYASQDGKFRSPRGRRNILLTNSRPYCISSGIYWCVSKVKGQFYTIISKIICLYTQSIIRVTGEGWARDQSGTWCTRERGIFPRVSYERMEDFSRTTRTHVHS